MMKWMLAAGAAALAIAAPVTAERGSGDKERGQSAQKAERGGGQKTQKAKASRSGGKQQARANRGGGKQQVRAERGGGSRQAKADRGGGKQQVRAERGGGSRQAKADRSSDRARSQSARFARTSDRDRDQISAARVDNRARGRDDIRVETRGRDRAGAVQIDDNRGRGRENVRTVKVDRDAVRGNRNARFAVVDGNDFVRIRNVDRGVVRVRDVDRDDVFVRQLGFGVGGCPPGLAKKPIACMPPGQAAKLVGEPLVVANRFGALAPLPLSMRSLYWDDDDYYYRYGGNYVYRVDRDDDLIAAMIPLFGAALVGQPLQPYYLNNNYRPSYFNAFYPNSQYDCYRYGFGFVYETDCMTGFVEDVIPTYDYGYGVGQLLPASYGYYNLPYQYRGYFADNDDYYYRYAPGAIYRVDRGTALITAVAALLTGGLTVGQPLPTGYSAYNVPLAYRTTYFDTPDAWYRYDNGYIYGVDPRTRMVNNVAYVIV